MKSLREKDLLASNWKFAGKLFDQEVSEKFRVMQIDAFLFEKLLANYDVKIKRLDYVIDKKSVYFEVEFEERYAPEFFDGASNFWFMVKDRMPIHRNDVWIVSKNRPEVSEIYQEHANGNWVLSIKLNPKSKRYLYPSPTELALSESVVFKQSNKYFSGYLK
jgi:hypothetical protein